jgi:hypothetical protein
MVLLTVRADAVARSPTDLLADPIATTICTKDAHIPAEGLPCWYYMAAVQNMTALCDERGEKFLGICRPPNNCAYFVRIFCNARVRKTADREKRPAFALLGLDQAFPC